MSTRGIDFLTPAIGDVHGPCNAVENIKVDFLRLASARGAIHGKVTLVMHGTNEFTQDIFKQCVEAGVTRLDVNQIVLWRYDSYARDSVGSTPPTVFMEQGAALKQERIEWMNRQGRGY